jgi:hypothetical protein
MCQFGYIGDMVYIWFLYIARNYIPPSLKWRL